MTPSFRRAPQLALVLILALASVSAPLRAAVGLPVEICARDGVRVLLVDPATGAPLGDETAACERCMLCAAAPPPEPSSPRRATRRMAALRPAVSVEIAQRARRLRRARAPPRAPAA
ncbi:hypothetical protein [Rubrimonas sp.]|uniref:hypothetical protein n=1 Tax=Rubrimonas sp. TaxID=2036015 RepID=UPI002FDC9593